MGWGGHGATKQRKVYRVSLRQAQSLGGAVSFRDGQVHGWVNCAVCRQKVDFSLRGNTAMTFSLDHIIPRWVAQDHSDQNLRVAHRKCNQLRGSREQPGHTKGHKCPVCKEWIPAGRGGHEHERILGIGRLVAREFLKAYD